MFSAILEAPEAESGRGSEILNTLKRWNVTGRPPPCQQRPSQLCGAVVLIRRRRRAGKEEAEEVATKVEAAEGDLCPQKTSANAATCPAPALRKNSKTTKLHCAILVTWAPNEAKWKQGRDLPIQTAQLIGGLPAISKSNKCRAKHRAERMRGQCYHQTTK